MDNSEILGKLQGIFRDVFDDNKLKLSEATGANEIEGWDSLAHINIILAIEKEFHIKFDLSEAGLLNNVGKMIETIGRKIG